MLIFIDFFVDILHRIQMAATLNLQQHIHLHMDEILKPRNAQSELRI